MRAGAIDPYSSAASSNATPRAIRCAPLAVASTSPRSSASRTSSRRRSARPRWAVGSTAIPPWSSPGPGRCSAFSRPRRTSSSSPGMRCSRSALRSPGSDSNAWRRADLTDGQLDLELEITTLKNRRIWIRVVGHIEKLEARSVRAFGSVQNIQDEKLAQIALENSTGWLKLSMNMAHMHAWRWDKATDRVDFAIIDRPKRHLPAVFPTMAALLERVHPKDRPIVARAIETGFDDRTDKLAEFRLKVDNRGYRSYATTVRPVFDADGKPQGFVGVTQDVTSRREAEAKLRRSEQLLRATTSNTADTLIQ